MERRITRHRAKSKFQSVEIIRENQPEKFRQTNNHQQPQNNADDDNAAAAGDDDDDTHWEDGSSIPSSSLFPPNQNNPQTTNNGGMTIEFDALPESAKKKRIRRATAEDKEVAELVHKVHLLCLLGRGRLVDAACDDPLIQAALLSLLPPHLLNISETTMLTAKILTPLVSWCHRNFQVRCPSSEERPFHSALAYALETHGGSSEEVAALSVALFRALNLTTRFVSILDAAPLKAEVDVDEPSNLDICRESKQLFDSSTVMVSKTNRGTGSTKTSDSKVKNIAETAAKPGTSSGDIEVQDSLAAQKLMKSDQTVNEAKNTSEEDKHPKRKGDLEFEMQLEMAMAATSAANAKRKSPVDMNASLNDPSNSSSPFKKLKRIAEESSLSPHAISTAIGSKKVGAPLYWAEVYCSGENMTGKWVHIDVVNAIVDGELKVEAAAAACKRTLRYVAAFAGKGVKDVTRRYCTKWYKISPQRISSDWWDAVLCRLKELESRATSGMVTLCQSEINVIKDHERSHVNSSSIASRSTLEDMELATRALTEPLPTNQQAYRNHPLYAIEKWLTKYQILHPRGPVLGFCSGHAVYPRTCVQNLHTKERWLREGLQVRDNELPAKVVKSTPRNRRGQVIEEADSGEGGSDGVTTLFGKWQTEPLCLPRAVDGIVPKNERGQVDVWSEKCLPPGTVHLRLPRLVPVVRRLEIDFAPAMVGFEFRNGRSVPVYEGLVVCTEFREAILEAYAEEEQKREEEEKKRDERQALSRWYQLLSSMVTRRRLNNSYRHDLGSDAVTETLKSDNNTSSLGNTETPNESTKPRQQKKTQRTKVCDSEAMLMQNHEHVFLTDDDESCSVEDSMTRTKKCRCGLSIQVEEL